MIARKVSGFLHSLLAVSLLVAGCESVAVTISPTPLPTPESRCRSGVCIKEVHVSTVQGAMALEFVLTDANGEVKAGTAPRFHGDQLVAVWLPQDADETYLFGVRSPEAGHMCYTGNDFPWSKGKLAAVCSILLPLSQMQVRPESGAILRVANSTFEFEQLVVFEADDESE